MSESMMITLNTKLSLAFSQYVIQHPELLDGVPQYASIVFASSKHPALTKRNMRVVAPYARKYKTKYYVATRLSRGWKIEKADFGK